MQPESGDPLDWQNPQNRHGGRIRCVAESAATHREMCFTASTNHAGTPPIAERKSRHSAGPQRWVAPQMVRLGRSGSRHLDAPPKLGGSGEPIRVKQSREIHSTGRIPKIGTVAESDDWPNQPPGTGRCVSRGQRTTRALRQSPKAKAGSQPDRNGGWHREMC